MGELVFKDLAALYGAEEFSGQFRTANFTLGQNVVDNTDISQSTRTVDVGKNTASFSGSGHWIASGQNVDSEFSDLSTGKLLTLVPEGLTAGNTSYSMSGLGTGYAQGGSVGDVLGFTVSIAPQDDVYRGVQDISESASGPTFNGTILQLGAPAATDIVFGAFHITAFTGTDWRGIIQSDDSAAFSSAVNRVVGPVESTTSHSLLKFTGGQTDDWWRLVVTGTFTAIQIEAFIGLQVL